MMLFLKILIGAIIAVSLIDLFFLPEHTYKDAYLDYMKVKTLQEKI